jgi:hypothetical protein
VRSLIQFLQRPEVENIIARCRESKAVQGVNIRLNRWWLAAWRIGERYLSDDPRHGFELAMKMGELPDELFFWPGLTPLDEPWIPFRRPEAADLKWRPPLPFFRHTESPPIIVTICLYPDANARGEVPRAEFSMDFIVVYEVQPIAYLYAGPRSVHRPVIGGVSIGTGPDDVGTLGGILKDENENWYGLTCAHVAALKSAVEQPARADSGKGSMIGTVIHREAPPAFPVNLKATAPNQRAYAGQVDAALVLIDKEKAKQEVLRIGRINGIIVQDDLEQQHRLEVTGRSSDWKVLQYGGPTPFYNIEDRSTGKVHCFENPIMLRDSTGHMPVKEGDSGAWLCVPAHSGYRWAGMVIGGDSQVGFAVSASALKSWWEDAPRNLRLVLS